MSCSAEADPGIWSAYGGDRRWKQSLIFVIRYQQWAACGRWVFHLLITFDNALFWVVGIHHMDTSKDFLLVNRSEKVWRLHILIPCRIVVLCFKGWTQHEGWFYHICKLSSCCGARLVSLINRLLDCLKSFCWPNVAESVTLWSLLCACWTKLLT